MPKASHNPLTDGVLCCWLLSISRLLLVFRQLRNVLTEEVIRDLAGDSHAIEELEAEWRQLCEDRENMRQVKIYYNLKETLWVDG